VDDVDQLEVAGVGDAKYCLEEHRGEPRLCCGTTGVVRAIPNRIICAARPSGLSGLISWP